MGNTCIQPYPTYMFLYLFFPTAVDCGPLDPPMDGSVTLTGTVFGSVATYSCNDGFGLEGEETRECQANSQWSGEAPTCVRKYCIGILFFGVGGNKCMALA